MAKKIIENRHSKLAVRTAGKGELKTPIGLVARRTSKLLPKSFRLRLGDLERLSGIVAKLNEYHPGRAITEIDVIRALLVIGSKTAPERLVAAIRETVL